MRSSAFRIVGRMARYCTTPTVRQWPIWMHCLTWQGAGPPRRARGAVAFAADEERRAPEVVFVQEAADELPEGGQIVLHAPKVGAISGAVRAAEARAHGVDEDQIAGIQETVGIVDVCV